MVSILIKSTVTLFCEGNCKTIVEIKNHSITFSRYPAGDSYRVSIARYGALRGSNFFEKTFYISSYPLIKQDISTDFEDHNFDQKIGIRVAAKLRTQQSLLQKEERWSVRDLQQSSLLRLLFPYPQPRKLTGMTVSEAARDRVSQVARSTTAIDLITVIAAIDTIMVIEPIDTIMAIAT